MLQMEGLDLKLIIKEDKAYLAHGYPLSFQQLGLPDWTVAFYTPAYWIIHIIKHNLHDESIFCEIKSYHTGTAVFEGNQLIWENELAKITRIKFRGLSTEGLSKTMNHNRPMKMPALRDPKDYNHSPSFLDIDSEEEWDEIDEIEIPSEYISNSKNDDSIYLKQSFKVPFKDLRFIYGGVQFKRFFPQVNDALELTISNYELREEFDAIKNYFANILQTKKINVYLDAVFQSGALTINHIDSPEIRNITRSSIDQVKFEFVRSFNRPKVKIEPDKSLFTMDEYFDAIAGEKFKSNTFYENEKELLDDILQITDTKHYKHLRYLSSIHAHTIMKLRFIIKPFSFLFLVAGDKNYHIIWETLDSEEATYIWHTDKNLKSLKLSIQKIEDIINTIKVQGKVAYINTSEDPFRRIFHDYSDLVDGFIKWKGELDSILF